MRVGRHQGWQVALAAAAVAYGWTAYAAEYRVTKIRLLAEPADEEERSASGLQGSPPGVVVRNNAKLSLVEEMSLVAGDLVRVTAPKVQINLCGDSETNVGNQIILKQGEFLIQRDSLEVYRQGDFIENTCGCVGGVKAKCRFRNVAKSFRLLLGRKVVASPLGTIFMASVTSDADPALQPDGPAAIDVAVAEGTVSIGAPGSPCIERCTVGRSFISRMEGRRRSNRSTRTL